MNSYMSIMKDLSLYYTMIGGRSPSTYKSVLFDEVYGAINDKFLRIKIWMLGEKKLWTLYLGGLKGIYDPWTLLFWWSRGARVSFSSDGINEG